MTEQKSKLRKAGSYLTIAGIAIGLPLMADLSGASTALARHTNSLQRQGLVSNLANCESVELKKFYEENLNHIDKYQDVRETSARFGIDGLVGLLGLLYGIMEIPLRRE